MKNQWSTMLGWIGRRWESNTLAAPGQDKAPDLTRQQRFFSGSSSRGQGRYGLRTDKSTAPFRRESLIHLTVASATLFLFLGCTPQPTVQRNALSAQTQSTPTAGSNSTPAAGTNATPSPAAVASSLNASPAAASPTATPTTGATAAASGPTVTVTIYKSDAECVNFTPQQVQVSANDPIGGAVGKLLGLDGQDAGEFDLGGYRVSVDAAKGEATVDLRMNPNSRRQIASLSACEQFALFGSLRETLTKNPQWKIRTVKFTERGKDIVL